MEIYLHTIQKLISQNLQLFVFILWLASVKKYKITIEDQSFILVSQCKNLNYFHSFLFHNGKISSLYLSVHPQKLLLFEIPNGRHIMLGSSEASHLKSLSCSVLWLTVLDVLHGSSNMSAIRLGQLNPLEVFLIHYGYKKKKKRSCAIPLWQYLIFLGINWLQ